MNTHIDISSLTREEKIDLLSKDFLERDGDHFVRIRRSGRLGWEDTLPADSAYSSVLVNPRSDEDLLKNAYRLARQMIVAMDAPFKVSVRIDATRSCTDSRSVFVASKVLDDQALPVGRRLDVFLGLAIHEGSHLLYTDFTSLPDAENEVVHSIQNVLEDERIERELGERKPGLANFIKSVKQYHFGRYEEAMGKKEEAVRLGTFARLFNAVFSIVRYPSSLDMGDAAEYADTLLEVRDLLDPYPESTSECLQRARDIYELIKERLSREKQEPEDTAEGVPGQEGESGGEPSGEPAGGKGVASGADGRQGEGPKSDGASGEGSPVGGSPQAGDGTKEGGAEAQRSASQGNATGDAPGGRGGEMTDEEIRRLFGEIEDAVKELTSDPSEPGTNPLGEDDMAEAARKDGALLAKECEGMLERGEREGTVVIRPEDDADAYSDSLSRVRRFIPAVAQALRCNSTEYAYTLTGMRSGLLDTNKLGEAKQGVQTVYVRKGEVRSERVSVALVIDESGSMCGIRERLARDTAVLVNEAVGKIPNVGLYIYGYTSAGNKNIVRNYREGDVPGRGHGIGSIGSFGGTPTAAAILEAASRIRRRTSERALMFIVSDGCAEGGARSVRAATDEVRRNGFTPVGISIASSLPADELRRMYDSYIVMDDVGSLASSLGKIVKKAVLRAAGRKTL